ncbi:Rho GTPase-activating protein, putative [Entamoeba invadens IP1]|uniref:Rho GTPase-activating protein, putative n=1 Tax=Entamoeba invadens IP1 TaxID=370355 RepID=A0A0A1TZ81_ENTIV|nr:Rho GTPase-activating protein, putative [Entamoeba invadens IP1]ELP86859.1 Rho GTPase-activating protein, putative [Entamoeba invadens IP1]|eukprot:XP_004253630.1 Rho GTPase-activating protein, putative [Entamoeba invadens IP1]
MSTPKKVCGWVEYRVSTQKKFSKMYMSLSHDALRLYASEDSKEKLVLLFTQAVFNKKISNKNKFPEDKIAVSFEVVTDKCHQFICPSKKDFNLWINNIPLFCNFTGVFGYPLLSTSTKKKSGWRFPIPLYRSIEYIKKKEGLKEPNLFKNQGKQEWVNRLKSMLDSGQDVCENDFGPEGVSVAASIIKLYISELSDGLIPSALYQQFVSAGNTDNVSTRVRVLKRLIAALPDSNRHVLWYFCDFLNDVIKNEKVNRMGVVDIAAVFAPDIIRPDVETPVDPENTKRIQVVMETFLTQSKVLADAASENKKMGMASPSYPAVKPTGAVSEKVFATQVAEESKKLTPFKKREPTGERPKTTMFMSMSLSGMLKSSGKTSPRHLHKEDSGRSTRKDAGSTPKNSSCDESVNNKSEKSDTQNEERFAALEKMISDLSKKVDEQNKTIKQLNERVAELEKKSVARSSLSSSIQKQKELVKAKQSAKEEQKVEPLDFAQIRKNFGKSQDKLKVETPKQETNRDEAKTPTQKVEEKGNEQLKDVQDVVNETKVNENECPSEEVKKEEMGENQPQGMASFAPLKPIHRFNFSEAITEQTAPADQQEMPNQTEELSARNTEVGSTL